jgi:hypothetical protein
MNRHSRHQANANRMPSGVRPLCVHCGNREALVEAALELLPLIENTEQSKFYQIQAAQRYYGKIVVNEFHMYGVEDQHGITHTDPMLRAISLFEMTPEQRKQYEADWKTEQEADPKIGPYMLASVRAAHGVQIQ